MRSLIVIIFCLILVSFSTEALPEKTRADTCRDVTLDTCDSGPGPFESVKGIKKSFLRFKNFFLNRF
jgi:hypothetical protein